MVEYLTQFAGWLSTNVVEFVLPFMLVLSVLVFIHEWGHYIVARRCGVRVEVFSIGFGKELFGFTAKNGTRWKFCLIPLGGYVKMFGDVDPASARHEETVAADDEGHVREMTDDERKVAFFSQPVAKRAAIVFAGPAINFLFAIAIFTAVFATQGKHVTPPLAGAIIKDGAAYSYGIQPRDRIVDINGRTIARFEDIQRQVSIALDEEMTVTVVRNGERLEKQNMRAERVEITDRHGFTHSRGMLGIMSAGSSLKLDNLARIGDTDVSGLDIEGKRQAFAANMDRTIEVEIKDGEDSTVYIIHPLTAENAAFISGETDRPVLLDAGEESTVHYSAFGAFVASLKETEEVVSGTLDALGQMFTGVRSPRELGGIIRIGAVAGDAAQAGMIALLTFAALLSINLGLLNLFPIPVLDGGHLVFYAIEAVKGSPVPEKVQEYALGTGMVLIAGLMLFANANDLVQLFMS